MPANVIGGEYGGEGVVTQYGGMMVGPDVIGRYTSLLGIMNDIRKTIPIISMTHKSAYGPMLYDLSQYHEAMKRVSVQYGIQIQAIQKLSSFSRQFNMDQRMLLETQKQLREIHYAIQEGRAPQANAVMTKIVQASGLKITPKQVFEDTTGLEAVKVLRAALEKEHALGQNARAVAERSRIVHGMEFSGLPGAALMEQAMKMPSAAEAKGMKIAEGPSEQQKKDLEVFRRLLGEINNLLAVVKTNFTNFLARIELSRLNLMLVIIKDVLGWVQQISQWFMRWSDTATGLWRVLGSGLGILYQLLQLLLGLYILERVRTWANSLTGAMGYLGGAMLFVSQSALAAVNPMYRWIWTVQLGYQIINFLTTGLGKMLNAIVKLTEGVLYANGAMGLLITIGGILAMVIFQLAGGSKWLSESLSKAFGMPVIDKIEDTASAVGHVGDEINKVARTDIFGDILEQIMGLPDMVTPPLMEVLKKQTDNMKQVVSDAKDQLKQESDAVRQYSMGN
jgi:hypothetical protein